MIQLTVLDAASEIVPPATCFIELPDGFKMKHGGQLHRARMGYETWGRLSPARDNAVLILSGFSTSAHAASHAYDPSLGWWERMIGPSGPIDTDHWFVICVNTLGGCFGSTGPSSINPMTNRQYRLDFPDVSIEDAAEAAAHVVNALGINELACLIGTSMGGMTALSLLSRHPGFTRSHINISGAACATAFAIALRSLQRQAILSDPEWRDGRYDDAACLRSGMGLARMLGMISYRSAEEWEIRFARNPISRHSATGWNDSPFTPEFTIQSYLQQQADRFIGQYDPNCYLYLSRAIDRFNLSETMGGNLRLALSQLGIERALVIGTESDLLFPLWQQEAIAEGLSNANVSTEMVRVPSIQGHDAFLVDFDSFAPPIKQFLASL